MGSHTSNNFNRNEPFGASNGSPRCWSILVCDCYGLNGIWVCSLKDNILEARSSLWLCWYDGLLRGLESHVSRRTAEVLPLEQTASTEKLPHSSERTRMLAQKGNHRVFRFPVPSPDPFPPWCICHVVSQLRKLCQSPKLWSCLILDFKASKTLN